jgi:hypothetical protein
MAKEINIELNVIGYASRWGGMGNDVCIAVSGQGPNGKLKAKAYFDGQRIDIRGDGQYSPKHGISALYASEPIYKEIESRSARVAQEWIKDNPDAARVNRIAMAKQEVADCQIKVDRAKDALKRSEAELDKAKQWLTKVESAK